MKKKVKPEMVPGVTAHLCNPSTWTTETEES